MKIIAATYAPMHKNIELNTGIIPEYFDFLRGNNINGAFVNGSTGDFVSLTTKERMDLIDAWGKNKSDGFYLINQVGHTSLKEACALAEHSAGMVDAISALAPYYFRVGTIDNLIAYCKEIADKAPDTPFYYYHIPVLTGVDFKMTDFIQMAVKEMHNFAGIKFTKNDFIDFQACLAIEGLDKQPEMFFGVDEMFLPALSYGAKGCVGSTYNHLAPLYRKIHQGFTECDFTTSARMQKMAVDFVEILDSFGGFNGAGKSFMRYLGLDMGSSRFPHITLSDNQIDTAVELLWGKGLIQEYFSEYN